MPAFTDVPDPACEGDGIPVSECEPDGADRTDVAPLAGGAEAAETPPGAVETETQSTVVRTARGGDAVAELLVGVSGSPPDKVTERPSLPLGAVDVATGGGSTELLLLASAAPAAARAACAWPPPAGRAQGSESAARASTQPHHAYRRSSRSIVRRSTSFAHRKSIYGGISLIPNERH